MIYKYKILVVDDDHSVLRQAEDLLSDDYNVSLATSGEQALKFLNGGQKVDLILLDIMMPKMDGYETLGEIRKIPSLQTIPVVYLTGMSDPEFEVKALTLGANDYMTKPFDTSVFLARIGLRLAADNALSFEKIGEVTSDLSDVEIEVMKYIAKGFSNEEIATNLHYSYGYVKQIVSRIFEKLGIGGRKEIKNFLK